MASDTGNDESKRDPNLVRLTDEQKEKLSAQGLEDVDGLLIDPHSKALDIIKTNDPRGRETMWAE